MSNNNESIELELQMVEARIDAFDYGKGHTFAMLHDLLVNEMRLCRALGLSIS